MDMTSIWTAIKSPLAQATRDGLRLVGMYLLSKGIIQNDAGVTAFIGAGMTLAGLFWGWFTTAGYLKVDALLKKMMASANSKAAVKAAQALPAGAAIDTPTKSAVALNAVKILFMAIALPAFLLAAGSAHAQGTLRKPVVRAAAAPVDPLQKMMTDIENVQQTVVTGVITDLQAADADASTLTNASDPTSFRDPIAHACYPAAEKFLQSLPAATAPTGKFVLVQLFQKKRDFQAQIQAGLPLYLKMGCAPLLGDEVTIFTKMMGLVGVTVSAGALTGLFPAVAPLTLPALTLPAL